MTSHHTNINVKNKTKQNHNNTFNILKIYTTLCQNYILLYCKGHFQISTYKNINVEMKTIQ